MAPATFLKEFTSWAKTKIDAIRNPPIDEELLEALLLGDALKVRSCLKNGALPNGRDRGRNAPLNLAVRSNSYECVEALLQAKAKIGKSIHTAACFSSSQIIEALIQHGANPNELDRDEDHQSMSPILWASRHGNLEALKTLTRHGGDLFPTAHDTHPNALDLACMFNQPACVKWLIEHGADPLARDSKGYFPGLLAAKFSPPDSLRILIDAGTPINAQAHDGMSMAMVAAMSENTQALELLAELGADFHLRLRGRPMGSSSLRTGEFTAMKMAQQNKKNVSIEWFRSHFEKLDMEQTIQQGKRKAGVGRRI